MSTPDYFRARLDAMIDLKHPLAVLANCMPWAKIEASWAKIEASMVLLLLQKSRAACVSAGEDLYGSATVLAGAGLDDLGSQRLSIRLMTSLLYLKSNFNLSDEELLERWSENVVWQYFSGQEYYEPRWPCDATQIERFRCAIGKEGQAQLLKFTIESAVEIKDAMTVEFERIVVDTSVQENLQSLSEAAIQRAVATTRGNKSEAARRLGISRNTLYRRMKRRTGSETESFG